MTGRAEPLIGAGAGGGVVVVVVVVAESNIQTLIYKKN